MPEIVFTPAEADELLEFVEGEGSCTLGYDAGFRLYELLNARPAGEPCRFTIAPAEAAEMLEEVEECAEDTWSAAVSALLAERLRVAAGTG